MKELPLRDEELVLRSVEHEDLSELYELIYSDEDPEWKKWDAPYYPLERERYEHFEQRDAWAHGNGSKGARPCSIRVIEADGEIVGMISYYIEDPLSMWLEMGIVIYKPSRWGKGIGTRSLQLWSSHLFRKMPIVRVGLTTWSGNERMMRVTPKLDCRSRKARKCRIVEGVYYDSIRMGMLREEWEAADRLMKRTEMYTTDGGL